MSLEEDRGNATEGTPPERLVLPSARKIQEEEFPEGLTKACFMVMQAQDFLYLGSYQAWEAIADRDPALIERTINVLHGDVVEAQEGGHLTESEKAVYLMHIKNAEDALDDGRPDDAAEAMLELATQTQSDFAYKVCHTCRIPEE